MNIIPKVRPQILHAIVGTAGHVDHGKTSLVRLLTGCDTDRLPEEKSRGMSIDLGFAPCLLQGDDGTPEGSGKGVVGIVDVPGHRDFIRNMVAGAASIDVLLLVVAADDGVMPQTAEHMKIVRLLRHPLVFVALTKIDMVSAERLAEAQREIAAFFVSTGFPDAPIVPVSNKTGEGIGEIRETLERFVGSVQHRGGDGAKRAFRMNVERVFSVKGYGTVVTGIPLSGSVHVGEKVELLPGRHGLAVRTVQSYKMESEVALASCCCAINVREIDAHLVARGMTLAAPDVYAATHELLVTLENASDGPAAGSFKRRFDARLHSGTAAVEANVRLLEADELPVGSEGFAHIVLAEPLVAAAGDRFILRSLSPADTLGGGAVLSARPQRLRRHADALGRFQAAYVALREGDLLAAEALAGPDVILNARDALRLTQQTDEAARHALAATVAKGALVDLAANGGGGDYAVRSRIDELRNTLQPALDRYHHANPYVWGMSPALVCESAGITAKSFDGLAALLSQTGAIALRHGRLALAAFKPNISERLLTLRERIMAIIEKSGASAPARGNLIRDLAIAEADMKVLEKIILGDGTVLLLDGNFMLRTFFDDARAKLLSLFAKNATVELNAFKEIVGTNRKMAVAMLDAFDAEGLTRRVPDGRVLAKRSQQLDEVPHGSG